MPLERLPKPVEESYKAILDAFDQQGSRRNSDQAHRVLLEMAKELGVERAYDLLCMVIVRMDIIADIWKDATDTE
jgi:hypothetical protein